MERGARPGQGRDGAFWEGRHAAGVVSRYPALCRGVLCGVVSSGVVVYYAVP